MANGATQQVKAPAVEKLLKLSSSRWNLGLVIKVLNKFNAIPPE
jgi:hypothetical protein